jgi:hypothetical protein
VPLIIAHGQAKSGSTFLWQIAVAAAARANGLPQHQYRKTIFPDGVETHDFATQPTDEIIMTIEKYLPDEKFYVLKTHGSITPLISERVKGKGLIAFTSFRDPRDCVISMLDAGVKDRAKNNDRFFGKLLEVKDALRPVKFEWSARAREWTKCAGVLKIPYYLIASAQDRVVQLICTRIGLAKFTNDVQAQFRDGGKETITEFHKGIPDRFFDDMSIADVLFTSGYFFYEIAEIDRLTERWMTDFGYREIYNLLHGRREERMLAIRSQAG